MKFLTGRTIELSPVSADTLSKWSVSAMKRTPRAGRNQRELIKSFLREQPDIELYDIYVDDGFSGSNFDRPEFKRMIGDIEACFSFNCITPDFLLANKDSRYPVHI